jgi:hypothetical protein
VVENESWFFVKLHIIGIAINTHLSGPNTLLFVLVGCNAPVCPALIPILLHDSNAAIRSSPSNLKMNMFTQPNRSMRSIRSTKYPSQFSNHTLSGNDHPTQTNRPRAKTRPRITASIPKTSTPGPTFKLPSIMYPSKTTRKRLTTHAYIVYTTMIHEMR